MDQQRVPGIVCRLRELLYRRGWSQQKLARRTGLSRTTIASLCDGLWWHGTNAISLRVVATLCKALHVSPGTLLRLTYRPRPARPLLPSAGTFSARGPERTPTPTPPPKATVGAGPVPTTRRYRG